MNINKILITGNLTADPELRYTPNGKIRQDFKRSLTDTVAVMNQEITNLLKAYEKALNTSDTKAAMALYESNPIFMAQNAKPHSWSGPESANGYP